MLFTCGYQESHQHQEEGSADFVAVNHGDRDGAKTLRELVQLRLSKLREKEEEESAGESSRCEERGEGTIGVGTE